MPKRSRRTEEDVNETAFRVVSQSVKETNARDAMVSAAAAALGRLGGLRGGPARAAAMSPRQRRASARKAVLARWAKARAKTKSK